MPQRKTGNTLLDFLVNEPLLYETDQTLRELPKKSTKKKDLGKARLIWWDK